MKQELIKLQPEWLITYLTFIIFFSRKFYSSHHIDCIFLKFRPVYVEFSYNLLICSSSKFRFLTHSSLSMFQALAIAYIHFVVDFLNICSPSVSLTKFLLQTLFMTGITSLFRQQCTPSCQSAVWVINYLCVSLFKPAFFSDPAKSMQEFL